MQSTKDNPSSSDSSLSNNSSYASDSSDSDTNKRYIFKTLPKKHSEIFQKKVNSMKEELKKIIKSNNTKKHIKNLSIDNLKTIQKIISRSYNVRDFVQKNNKIKISKKLKQNCADHEKEIEDIIHSKGKVNLINAFNTFADKDNSKAFKRLIKLNKFVRVLFEQNN
jgi:hypothetical protein